MFTLILEIQHMKFNSELKNLKWSTDMRKVREWNGLNIYCIGKHRSTSNTAPLEPSDDCRHRKLRKFHLTSNLLRD